MADSTEIYKVTASLIGGGAVGAIITAGVTTYRNRVQPVAWRADVSPVFTPSFVGSSLNPTITVSDGTTDLKFSNLHVADVQVINRGNRDMPSFTFGITLGSSDHVVHIEPYGLDRHHVATLLPPVTPSKPSSTVDFTLKPFNRGNSYAFKMFVVAGGSEPISIRIGSAEAVRFVEIGALAEALAEAASSYVLKFGPLRIGVR